MIRILLILIVSFSGLSQIKAEDTLKVVTKKKVSPPIGIQVGYHTASLGKNDTDIDRNFTLGVYLLTMSDISSEFNINMGMTFWRSHTKSIDYNSSQAINSFGVKFGLEYQLFKIQSFSVSVGPLLMFEFISKINNPIFTVGLQLKFRHPLVDDKIFLVSSAAIHDGGEIMKFAGGEFAYSFMNYSLGIEMTPWK